jgi:uncharacterized membrane protein
LWLLFVIIGIIVVIAVVIVIVICFVQNRHPKPKEPKVAKNVSFLFFVEMCINLF